MSSADRIRAKVHDPLKVLARSTKIRENADQARATRRLAAISLREAAALLGYPVAIEDRVLYLSLLAGANELEKP